MAELPASSNTTPSDENEFIKMNTLRIIDALKKGESDSNVIDLIKLGCDVQVIDQLSMLHVAVERPTIDVALELIKLGVNVNAQNEAGCTPLSCARNRQLIDATAMLLYYGANIRIQDRLQMQIPTCFSPSELDLLLDYYNPDEIVESLGYIDFDSCHSSVSNLLTRLVEDGATINSFKYKCHPLSISIKESDLKLFKLIFSKIDMQRLAEFREILFEEFLSTNNFQKFEWLEGLYLTLECSQLSVLFQYYRQDPSLSKRLFRAVIEQCISRELVLQERIDLIKIFLSFGLFVDEDTIDLVHEYYGFNDELEAILYCGQFDQVECKFIMNRFILANDPSREDLNHYFALAVRSSFASLNQQEQLSKMFRYFWSPIRFSCVDDEVKEVSTVPSLVELSRNQTRKHIQNYCNVKKPYQFYDIIKRLHLPLLFHNIICIKEPIYP